MVDVDECWYFVWYCYKELLDWINNELAVLSEENFISKAYDATLANVYGDDFKESLVIEGVN